MRGFFVVVLGAGLLSLVICMAEPSESRGDHHRPELNSEKSFSEKSSSVRSPSRQREHQANERTFLAWLRTSISLIGFGFAIARFGLFLQQLEEFGTDNAATAFLNSRLIGIGLVGFGVLSILLASWRFNQAFNQIENGRYRPNRWAIWLLTGMVTCLGVLCIPLLF